MILIWVLASLLLLAWSLGGWALHALLRNGPALLDALPGRIEQLPYPAVLERWLPNWQELLLAAASALQAGLAWLGAAGVVLVWVVWAVGTLLVLLLAVLLTVAVRQLPKPPAPQANAASS